MNRRDFMQSLTSGAMAAPIAAGLAYPLLRHENGAAPATENTYQRVMRTGVIRCGYLEYAPNFIKDPVTGKVSGIFADLMAEIGRLQHLKIEWTESGGVTALLESLHDGRIDAVCSGLWPNALRAQHAEFSQPIFYDVLAVIARHGDTRFDNQEQKLNDPSIRFAVIDGEMADQIASVDFPRARKTSLPALSDFSQLLLTVAYKKADVTIAATHEFLEFDAHNPGLLRMVKLQQPLRTFPNVLFFGKGEFEMESMIDNAIDEIYYAGNLERIVSRHEKYPHSFIHVRKAN